MLLLELFHHEYLHEPGMKRQVTSLKGVGATDEEN